MKQYYFLALDIGAGSGRAVLGILKDHKLQIQELYRFPNGYVNIRGRLHWNTYTIFAELKKALAVCSQNYTSHLESLAIDTWGVDFGLLSKEGSLLSMPFSYRDSYTNGMTEDFAKNVMPLEDLYKLTGIQTMQINTLFQLYALRKSKSSLLSAAHDLLFTPDLLNYFFTGEKKTEYSIATTSQLLNPHTRQWKRELFEAIGVPVSIMQEVVQQGNVNGQVDNSICMETGVGSVPVISVASHDTGSAIAGIPAEDENWAYLSSGTWSLMGLELKQPIINHESARQNFTNEGGVEETYRFQKNLSGMWLLQQCKKIWDTGHAYSYDHLMQMASESTPFKVLIDTDVPEFQNPEDMLLAIRSYCIRTRQSVPVSHGEYVRCIFDSLAMKYRLVMGQLKKFSQVPIHKLFVIGGGARNSLLCQLTANALAMPVVTGPSEATAIGNIMMQARTLGFVSSLKEIRKVVGSSFVSLTYMPKDTLIWDRQEEIMKEIIAKYNS